MRRSTFSILFYVKKSGLKKNGNGVIMARITIDGEQTQFSTKMEILPDLWNNQLGKVGGYSASTSQINRQLDFIRSTLTVHYNKQMTTVGYCTPLKLKNLILGVEDKTHTILSYFQRHNDLYRLKVGVTTTQATYSKYKLTRARFEEFIMEKYKMKDMVLREVTTAILQEFYIFLRSEGNSANNNAMKHLQRLRTVFKYIMTTGFTDFVDPFLGFKMSFEKRSREFLEREEIEKIYNMKFESKSLEKVRDVFIFSCFSGLSYADIVELKAENIRLAFDNNLWIMGERKKTGIKFNVRLLDTAKEIIDKYSKGKHKDAPLLPCISNQKMNEYLKETAAI